MRKAGKVKEEIRKGPEESMSPGFTLDPAPPYRAMVIAQKAQLKNRGIEKEAAQHQKADRPYGNRYGRSAWVLHV